MTYNGFHHNSIFYNRLIAVIIYQYFKRIKRGIQCRRRHLFSFIIKSHEYFSINTYFIKQVLPKIVILFVQIVNSEFVQLFEHVKINFNFGCANVTVHLHQ